VNLPTIPYHAYEKGLPQEGNFILGHTRNGNIIVYQAFNDGIADYAIAHQKFGGSHYSFSRMTWIKPNFLWMMYRSGWAEKENQNRVLAIEITFEGFEELLEKGVATSHDHAQGDGQTWRQTLDNSDVRIQWDPDHNPKGDKLKRRAVQIGIKNEALQKFNDEFIKSVTDITDFVKQQKARLNENADNFLVINESIVEVTDGLKRKFSIPQTFLSPFMQGVVTEFGNHGQVAPHDFEKFLTDNGEKRTDLVDYIKNYNNIPFSRYLLQTAIAYRKGESGNCGCMCEDLLLFSYFVSKNKTPVDFDLIMQAKLADFDTWCGFDGEMVFYALGYQQTKEYLNDNTHKFPKETVDHFLQYTEDYLYNEINERAFWYL